MILTKAVQQLEQERERLEGKVERINFVLKTLGNLDNGIRLGRPRKFHHTAATKAKIAAANRARWAKVRRKAA